jgi:hypothetical protein
MTNKGELYSKILTSCQEIDTARRLLYTVYIKEGGWWPSSNNLSHVEFVASETSMAPMFIDRFDAYATWIAVFDKVTQDMAACGRILSRDKYGKFEMQYYSSQLSDLKLLNETSNPNIFEINRSAVLPQYRGTVAWLLLLRAAFVYCHEKKHAVFSNTAIDKVKEIHHSMNYPVLDNISFKYDPQDIEAVTVYYAKYPENTQCIIEYLDDCIKNKLMNEGHKLK